MKLFNKSREEIYNEPEGIMGANTVVLADDMLTVITEPKRIIPGQFDAFGTEFEGHAFYEASSIRKIDDTYYFIYSSEKSNELCYATSKYPDKDFKYRGTIISNGDIGYKGRKAEDRLNMTANNHGSIEYINGQWYVFYHRHTHSSTFSRQACAEPVTILSDGTIPQVEITSSGLNNGPLLAKGEYSAVIACNITNDHMPHARNQMVDEDIPFITHDDSNRFITGIQEGTLIGYKYFQFDGKIQLKVTTRGRGEGRFIVSTEADTIGEIGIESTENWTENLVEINAKGTQDLYLTFEGNGRFELLNIKFE